MTEENIKMSEHEQVNHIPVKLHLFWPGHVAVWFAQAEASFSISGITKEDTKYSYILSILPERTAAEIEDILTNPPKENKYQFLKSELIRRLSCSEEALKEDIKCSAAEIIYGEYADAFVAENFVSLLRKKMADIRPVPASRHCHRTSFLFRDLADACHVFLRDNTVRRSLQPPYTGPYKVMKRNKKTITLDISGRPQEVSVDRVKPAHLAAEPNGGVSPTPAPAAPADAGPTPSPPLSAHTGSNQTDIQPITTRSSRRVKFKPVFDL